jgi:hypothetical protein
MSSTDTTDNLTELLDRLEAAAAAATPGPWYVEEHAGRDGMVVMADGFRRAHLPQTRLVENAEADAALIVAAVNALPTLVAELRAHQAAVHAVRELADELEVDHRHTDYDLGAVMAADRLRAAVAALDPKEQDR